MSAISSRYFLWSLTFIFEGILHLQVNEKISSPTLFDALPLRVHQKVWSNLNQIFYLSFLESQLNDYFSYFTKLTNICHIFFYALPKSTSLIPRVSYKRQLIHPRHLQSKMSKFLCHFAFQMINPPTPKRKSG